MGEQINMDELFLTFFSTTEKSEGRFILIFFVLIKRSVIKQSNEMQRIAH